MPNLYPNESSEYRAARDRLLEKELELRRVTEEVAVRKQASVHRLLSPALQVRVSAQENPYLSMLGWKKDALSQAA